VVQWLQAQELNPDIHAVVMKKDGALVDDCSLSEEESSEPENVAQDLSDEEGSIVKENSEDESSEEGGEIVRVPHKRRMCATWDPSD
jgi:hypothetical protein